MTITLIVPIYNEEPFLHRCLDSIVNQTVKFDDVILLDDGSDDGSPELASLYAGAQKWTIVEFVRNCGTSATRNWGLGINNSRHDRIYERDDYIVFLDADDELTQDACEMIRKAIKKRPFENIIQFNHWRKYEGVDGLKMKHKEQAGVYTTADMPQKPFCWFAVWNKVYNGHFLRANNIRFDESLEWGEDTLFNVQAIIANTQVSQEDGAFCIRHFDNKQSLNHLCRDREHDNLLIEKLTQIRDKNPRIIDELIAQHKKEQEQMA